MVNPGTFQGSRGAFLIAQSDIYASAVADGRINDVVCDIQRRYLKRYPMSLPHDQEPTQEWLNQVNDDDADPEPMELDFDSMEPKVAEALKVDVVKSAELLKARKDAIKRRLHYIYSKNREDKSPTHKLSLDDPVSILRTRLTGIDTKYPRKKTPYNVWGPRNRTIVDPVFNQRVEELSANVSQHAAIRSAVYKELFENQPKATQEYWANIAVEEHDTSVREIEKKRKQGVPTSPMARQSVIAYMPKIIEPILDMLAEHTGWRFSLAAGGPEPADGGRLNMILIHSGVMPGTVKMDFGAAERDSFKNYIIPAFGRFMKKSYTIAECRSRALPTDHTCVSLNDIVADDEEQMHLHSFDVDDEHRAASQAPNQKGKRLFEDITSKGRKPRHSPPGIPSPQVGFVPPLGKSGPKRIPPTSNGNPRHKLKYIPSPLSQTSVTANEVNQAAGTDGLDQAAELQHSGEAPAPASPTSSSNTGTGKISSISTSTSAATPIDSSPYPNAAAGTLDGPRTSSQPPPGQSPPATPRPLSTSVGTNREISVQSQSPPATPRSLNTSVDSCESPLQEQTPPATPRSLNTSLSPERSAQGQTPLATPRSLSTSVGFSTESSAQGQTPPATPHPLNTSVGFSCESSAQGQILPATPRSLGTSVGFSPEHSAQGPTPLATPRLLNTSAGFSCESSAQGQTPPATPRPLNTSVGFSPERSAQGPTPLATPRSLSTSVGFSPESSAQGQTPPATPRLLNTSAGFSCESSAQGQILPATPRSLGTSVDSSSSALGPLLSASVDLSAAQYRGVVGQHGGSSMHLNAAVSPAVAIAAPKDRSEVETDVPNTPAAAVQYVQAASNKQYVPRSLSPPLSPLLSHPTLAELPSRSPTLSPPRSLPPSPIASRPSSPIQDEMAPAVATAVPPKQARKPSCCPSGTATVPELAADIDDEPRKSRKRKAAESTLLPGPSSSKRSRLSTTASKKLQTTNEQTGFDTIIPAHSPEYITKGMALLTREDLGPRWKELVEAWLLFEERAGFGKGSAGKRLLAVGRPPVVADWIKNARKPTYTAEIGNINKYSAQFRLWWRGIQPEWRLEADDGSLLRDGDDWDAIACAGQNGLLSALAALFFWGSACSQKGSDAVWMSFVDDAFFVISAATLKVV